MKYIEKYWILIWVVYIFAMFVKPVLCILILGSLCFYGGVSAIILLNKIHDRGIESVGRILSYVRNKSYKTPVVEFTPVDGDIVTAEPFIYVSTDLSKIRSYNTMMDMEVLVLYDPKDPKKFVLAGEKNSNYIFFFIIILVGLGFIVLSVCIFSGFIKIS